MEAFTKRYDPPSCALQNPVKATSQIGQCTSKLTKKYDIRASVMANREAKQTSIYKVNSPGILRNFGQKNIKDPQPQLVQDIILPDTALAKSIMEYARRELPEQTFNHSMRVYYYGRIQFVPP